MWIRALLLFATGCSITSDGAVELSWTFRPASSSLPDMFEGCNANNEGGTHPIESIALDWDVDGAKGSFSWPCGNFTGATGFDVPPGQAALTVRPICTDAIPLDPASFIAPAPIVRDVAKADVVSLGVIEIVIQVSSCLEQPCVCHS